MFKKILKNNKGFSLAELLVTLALLGLVTATAYQLLAQFQRTYNAAHLRYEVQSAVTLASRKFETNRDSIVNAYQADLLYDPNIESGIIVTDEGEFEWIEKPVILPDEDTELEDNPYTYIFSAPAYDEEGAYLGSYLFIREFDKPDSKLFLDDEGMGDIPVNIKFRIAKNTGAPPVSVEPDGGEPTTEDPDANGGAYIAQSIEVEFQSGRTDIVEYNLITQYALANIERRHRDINYLGKYTNSDLVFEEAWVGKDAGPAGWTDGALEHFPVKGATYKDGQGNKATISNEDLTTLQKEGNVMRFISPSAFKTIPDADDLTTGANLASCLTSFAFSDPSKLSSHVLGSLRDFRDNVLAGTAVGDWVIKEYYNVWSPFLIEKAGFLKPVYRAVLVPVSYVCGFIANM